MYRAWIAVRPCNFWVGPDGRFKYVSQACEQISGHTQEEFLANPELMADIIYPDDRAAYRQHLANSLHADMDELEFRIVLKDGSVRWIGHHCKPIQGENGEFLGRHGANRDITVRKQAEDQLRKLAQAVEQSPESIIISNLDAEIEYVNEAFLRNTGYSREEVIGQNTRILHSGKTPRGIYEALWDAMTHGQPWKGEFTNKRKDGSEFVEFAIITPIREPDGRITHYVTVQEDITEKKQIGEELNQHRHHLEELVEKRTTELRQQSHSLQALIDNLPHMAWLKDKEGRFIAVNRVIAEANGHTTEELLGKTDLDLWPREMAERLPRRRCGSNHHASPKDSGGGDSHRAGQPLRNLQSPYYRCGWHGARHGRFFP